MNLLHRATLSLALLALVPAAFTPVAHAQLRTPRVSPDATVKQTIGITDVTVTYCRPGVKGRTIWGQLVPYGQPWRTGANEATTFTTTDDVTIDGQPLPAGKYSLFTLPTESTWQVVFSRQHDLWGAYQYDPSQDALRVTVTPTAAEHEEWMRFAFEGLTANSADLVLRWEKLSVKVTVGVDVNARVTAAARTAVSGAKGDDWRTPYQAARWAFDNGQALDEAAKWLERSLTAQTNYANLGLKARWLQKDGKVAEAVEAGRKAVDLGKADPAKPDVSALEKSVTEWAASVPGGKKAKKKS